MHISYLCSTVVLQSIRMRAETSPQRRRWSCILMAALWVPVIGWISVLANVRCCTTHLAESNVYKSEGGQVTLPCEQSKTDGDMTWIFPVNSSAKCNMPRFKCMSEIHLTNSVRTTKLTLTISDLTKSDNGCYTCESKSKSDGSVVIILRIKLRIYDANENPPCPRVTFNASNQLLYGETLDMSCDIDVDGPFVWNWTFPQPQSDTGPVIASTPTRTALVVVNVTETTKGAYGCRLVNTLNRRTCLKSIFVDNIYEKRGVFLRHSFARPGANVTLTCTVVRVYNYKVEWLRNVCPSWIKTDQFPGSSNCSEFQEITKNQSGTTVTIPSPRFPGQIKCVVTNDGTESFCDMSNLYVQDMDRELVIVAKPHRMLFTGNVSTIECFASMYIFRDSVEVFKIEGKAIVKANSRKDIFLSDSHTDYMYRKILHFSGIQLNDAGCYKCVARTFENASREDEICIDVYGPPHFDEIGITQKVADLDKLVLHCDWLSVVTPVVKWFKDDVEKHPNTNVFMNRTHLVIDRTCHEDVGTFECRVTNDFGTSSKYFKVVLKTDNQIVAAGLALVLTVTSLFVILLVSYGREYMKHLMLKRIATSRNPNETARNFEMSLVQPDDPLPYDARYDFRMKDLTLGVRLGVGAFGEVLCAKAVGIRPGEHQTTVAVKRTKNGGTDDDIRSLIAEMKIMANLGSHLNILNLLGVVHENLSQHKQLLVITEFCAFGNLLDFMRQNRADFVDQIDAKSGKIDVNVVAVKQPKVMANKNRGASSSLPTSAGHTFSTTDLVCWSYQVAHGMSYLAGKGVLHGDLAARNILLADGNVVKVSDFGLSRWMLPEENYMKKSKTALPIKWMAIESIEERVFDTSSDIWSFGVVMWELFSLGAAPYSDIPKLDCLAHLRAGNRLARPEYATPDIYHTMDACWLTTATDRPRFSTIISQLAKLLPGELIQNFHDMNAEYVNIKIQSEPRTSAFVQIDLPDEKAPESPSVEVVDTDTEAESAQTFEVGQNMLATRL